MSDVRDRILILALLLYCTVLPIESSAGTVAGNDFEQELFAPVEITKSIHLPRPPEQLTGKQKTDLLAVKELLVRFLLSFKKDETDPMQYLTPELQGIYKTRAALYEKEFGAEAYLEMKIFDFAFAKGGQEIELRFDLTDTNEGTICIVQRALSYRETPQGWKVSGF
ncbi:MAG: hypothetical protein E8D46_01310 [Nitrospira sp.]|nr:MAG: hypothetical protein E8D46_01310 [Nitrospira sp.]